MTFMQLLWMRSFANKEGRFDLIFGGRTSTLALPLAPERYRYSKRNGNVCLQNYKRYFNSPQSSAISHPPPQLEDENVMLQEEITSNDRQFDENEKSSESLLDVLDKVRTSVERRNFSQSVYRLFATGIAFQETT